MRSVVVVTSLSAGSFSPPGGLRLMPTIALGFHVEVVGTTLPASQHLYGRVFYAHPCTCGCCTSADKFMGKVTSPTLMKLKKQRGCSPTVTYRLSCTRELSGATRKVLLVPAN